MTLSKAVKIVITAHTLPHEMKVYSPEQLIAFSKSFEFLEHCPLVRVWSIASRCTGVLVCVRGWLGNRESLASTLVT